jgi:hypothetical protein
MKKRRLISEDQIIVVIDTSPIRNLAYDEEPEWVETFAEMSKDGYSFSLADATVAELLTQIRSGRIPSEGYERMIQLVKTFLNLDFPMLPGKIDLEAMIGVNHTLQSLDETIYLAREGWRQLLSPHAPTFALGASLEDLLEEERREWAESLEEMKVHTICYGIDIARSDPDDVAEFLAELVGGRFHDEDEIEPAMEVRMHLELRYRFRQMARSAQRKNAYDPGKKRNRNDGIDVDLYKYFILPALAVAEDSGFFSSLDSIQSFQKDWFYRPEQLAARWLAGERPQPVWPQFDEEED